MSVVIGDKNPRLLALLFAIFLILTAVDLPAGAVVNIASGKVVVSIYDYKDDTFAFPLEITRTYNESLQGERDKEWEPVFGQKWTFNYNTRLVMYWDFTTSFINGLGTRYIFRFRPTRPWLLVDGFEGDPLLDYPLDQGLYRDTFGNSLRRLEDGRYEVVTDEGFRYLFDGFWAEWRKRQGHQKNTAGKLLSLTDPGGHVTTFYYDEKGRLASVADSSGRFMTFSWQGDLISTIQTPQGERISYRYDDRGRLVDVTYPDSREGSYIYDANGRLKTRIGRTGGKVNYDYNEKGRCVKIILGEDYVLNTFEYQGDGRTVMRDHDGASTVYDFDKRGWVFKITYDDSSVDLVRDAMGNIVKSTDSLGETRRFEYGQAGRLKGIQSSSGSTVGIEYRAGQMARVVDSVGHSVELAWSNQQKLEGFTLNKGEFFSLSQPKKTFEPEKAFGPEGSTMVREQLKRASELVGSGRLDEAEAMIAPLLKHFPRLAVPRLLQALIYAGRGEFKKALAEAETAVRLNPTIRDGYRMVALLAERLKDWKKAGYYYLGNLPFDPQDAESYERLAIAYERQGRLAEAVAFFNIAMYLDPYEPQRNQAYKRYIFEF